MVAAVWVHGWNSSVLIDVTAFMLPFACRELLCSHHSRLLQELPLCGHDLPSCGGIYQMMNRSRHTPCRGMHLPRLASGAHGRAGRPRHSLGLRDKSEGLVRPAAVGL